MKKRALLLVNRDARQGATQFHDWIQVLESSGFELVEKSTAEPARLAEIIVAAQDGIDLVIIGGGDGTLNAAASGLVAARVPLGIVPLGTANDLARTLSVPADPIEACRVIAAGHTRRIDLGVVNDKHFFNVASVGLSVEISRRLTKERKRIWGVFAYLWTAMQTVYLVRPFRAEIRTPDATYLVKTVQIAVGNGRHYGGGMTVADDASIVDQRLDLYSIEVRHWWQVFNLLPALRKGTLSQSKHARTMHGSSFEIVPRHSRSVNTDGEVTTRTPAKFRILPGAVTVFVPPEDSTNEAGSGAKSS